MWNEIFNLAIKNGIWAVLFLGLFVFVIKDSSKREQKYQQTINDLTAHLGIVKGIKEDIDEIKSFVYKTKRTKSNKKSVQVSSQKNDKTTKIIQNNDQETKTIQNKENKSEE